NAGDQYGACEELKKWVYVKKKVWRGLVNRREAEAAICHGNL
ncbi:lysozyme, partial [Providencia hangzhouensis]